MPRVKIPTPLRRFAQDQSTVDVEARTVGDALEGLVAKHETLRNHLFDENGKLRNFVNVYLNDTDVRTLDDDKTPVKEDDTVVIVPSIAGGACDA